MSNETKMALAADTDTIEMEAAEWLMRLSEGDISANDINNFKSWQCKNPDNKGTFDKLSAIWDSFAILGELEKYAAENSTSKKSAVLATIRSKWLDHKHLTSVAMAAGIILAVFISVFYNYWDSSQTTFVATYATAVGEQETFALPDGSTVELNTNSTVNINFTEDARHIQLTNGQAFFKVAHDKSKPFSVFAGQGVVTAVGTQFSVTYRTDIVDVVVAEGRVALSPKPSEFNINDKKKVALSAPLIELNAQQAAEFNEKVRKVETLDTAAQERRLSWRSGLLAFSGEPLTEFINEMSRYTNVNIEIKDDDIRNLPVAGYFKVGEVEAMFDALDALEVMLDIDVKRVDENHVVLSKKAPHKTL